MAHLLRRTATFLLAVGAFSIAHAESGKIEWNGTTFLTFTTPPEGIELFWREPGSTQRYGQFSRLQASLAAEGKSVHFMMNGGIFEEGGIPSGLLIIGGKVLNPLNVSPGAGNFYLQPNGVFFVDAGGARILSTQDYALRKPSPLLAVQSGPLLLQQGRIHHAFRKASPHLLHRNGVGIKKDGTVLFAITEFGQKKYCNLFEFAEFFKAQGCENALFLDGDISQMVVDPTSPITPGNFFGTIFAITKPAQ